MSEPMALNLAEQYVRYAAEHEGDRAAARLLAEYDARGAALERVREVAESLCRQDDDPSVIAGEAVLAAIDDEPAAGDVTVAESFGVAGTWRVEQAPGVPPQERP